MKLPFKNPYLLAPMEEINDIAFRLLCKKADCGQTYTGMIHPLTKQKISLTDYPILQMFCTSPKGVGAFIKKHESKVAGFDLNLGCPAKTARKHSFGSFLTDLKTIEKILKTMRASTKKFLSVKIRKSANAFEILRLAEKYCDALAVHPRTQAQGYSGAPDIAFAKKIKSFSKIPIIYSGNIDEKNANQILKIFDAVMLGRNAIGNPEIFSKLAKTKPKNLNFKNYLTLAKKYKLPFRQLKLQAMNFTKGKENAKQLRLKIFKTKKVEELEKVEL